MQLEDVTVSPLVTRPDGDGALARVSKKPSSPTGATALETKLPAFLPSSETLESPSTTHDGSQHSQSGLEMPVKEFSLNTVNVRTLIEECRLRDLEAFFQQFPEALDQENVVKYISICT